MTKCVHRRGKGYQAKVQFGGKRYSRWFPTEDLAEAWVLQARAADRIGDPVPPVAVTKENAISTVRDEVRTNGANPYSDLGKRFCRALCRLNDLHKDMTMQQGICLFYIAQNPGATQQSVCETLGFNDSAVSRTLAVLSDVGGEGVQPLRLIEVNVKPDDRRQRLVFLSAKGKRLMDDLSRDTGIAEAIL